MSEQDHINFQLINLNHKCRKELTGLHNQIKITMKNSLKFIITIKHSGYINNIIHIYANLIPGGGLFNIMYLTGKLTIFSLWFTNDQLVKKLCENPDVIHVSLFMFLEYKLNQSGIKGRVWFQNALYALLFLPEVLN